MSNANRDFSNLHVVGPDGIKCAYQPIVDLRNQQTVAYEALARWPDNPGFDPGAVFDEARRSGTLSELDRAAQLAAMRGARDAKLPPSYTLFVNVEADAMSDRSLTRKFEAFSSKLSTHPIVIELTERALLADPSRVIEITDRARSLGMGVALDDVGSNPGSLTMLDFVRPDVIKIDGEIIRTRRLSAAQSATIDTIAAYVEATPGTAVIAECIEDLTDLEQASALGATHGQGWLLGRPAPLPTDFAGLPAPTAGFGANRMSVAELGTPAELLGNRLTQTGRRSLLIGLTRHLEDIAAALGEPATVLGAFQHNDNFTAAVGERFSAIATNHPHAFVAALAIGMPSEPALHVRGVDISREEPLADEWTITVMSGSYFGALIARDSGDPVTDPDRRYSYTLTHDRRIVTDAARLLMQRIRAQTAASPVTVQS